MESGIIVEYIDRQKIFCAVILEIKNSRLRLLTENNREVSLSSGRLTQHGSTVLDISMGRDRLVEVLRETAGRRSALAQQIDIKELWEVLNTEQEWIDLATMTELCFPGPRTVDHESAVIRAFFENRTYFKFTRDGFFPHSLEHIEKSTAQARETVRKERIIEAGVQLIRNGSRAVAGQLSEEARECIEIIKSVFLFGKESPHYPLGKAILAKAGITSNDALFQLLVTLGEMDENENIGLLTSRVSVQFSENLFEIASKKVETFRRGFDENGRRDLTDLPLFTIDGQSTLDFDDALSLEKKGDHYRLGIHIADVAHFVKKGDHIDQEALTRGSSVYMPDQKIPMLPSCLAEDLCSLKAGELRPAISIMADLSPAAEVLDYDIFASMIRVNSQLTYYDVNLVAEEHPDFSILVDIAKKFRRRRLSEGAVQISLPDINVWIDSSGEINISHINRESPGRMLVAELMILGNWLMAKFLSHRGVPTIFRSQQGPKERLYRDDGGTLFQNYMQRKLLSRFMLSPSPEPHAGLGLDVYTTATSPIRKYFDLVTQRQIRAALGLESFYTAEEIQHIIHMLEQPMSTVAKLQTNRQRYWIFKYLEKRIGQKEEALVLFKRKSGYVVLIPAYMIECELPLSEGINLNPENLIQVTIQHVNARKDMFSVFAG